jgi:hypothetical protein
MGHHTVVFAGQPIDMVFAPAMDAQNRHVEAFIGPARRWRLRLLGGLKVIDQQSRSGQDSGAFQEIPALHNWKHGIYPLNKWIHPISLREILSEKWSIEKEKKRKKNDLLFSVRAAIDFLSSQGRRER